MNKTFTTILSLTISLFSLAQTQITNGGFETWENVGATNEEPTDFNSNKTGSNTAQLGPQTCFRDGSIKHSGSYALRLENKTVFVTTVVNGSATTGVVNAPSTSKADGYIGTVNYSTSSDIRRLAFTGRPDSIVGWYQYTSGGTGEKGKVAAILHTNNYFDPETPTTYHEDPTADKVGKATFLTPTGSNSVWTRFTMPFVYTATVNPTYILISITPSNNQLTTFAGSKIWIDDISFIYNITTSVKENGNEKKINVYYFDKTIYVDSFNMNNELSTIQIYDVTGQLVFSQLIDNNSINKLDVSSVKSGIYMYKVIGRSQEKFGKLFID